MATAGAPVGLAHIPTPAHSVPVYVQHGGGVVVFTGMTVGRGEGGDRTEQLVEGLSGLVGHLLMVPCLLLWQQSW